MRAGAITGLLYCVAVRDGVRSRVVAFSSLWGDKVAVFLELGVYIVRRVWFLFCLFGILWFGNIFGLAQGRKPHGGFEGPCSGPPLIFVRGGGPRPLG
jgi:hypothetical protein